MIFCEIIQIKAAVAAVRNIHCLPSDQDFQTMDLLLTCSIFLFIPLDFRYFFFLIFLLILTCLGLSNFIHCVFQSGREYGQPKRTSNFPPCQCSY